MQKLGFTLILVWVFSSTQSFARTTISDFTACLCFGNPTACPKIVSATERERDPQDSEKTPKIVHDIQTLLVVLQTAISEERGSQCLSTSARNVNRALNLASRVSHSHHPLAPLLVQFLFKYSDQAFQQAQKDCSLIDPNTIPDSIAKLPVLPTVGHCPALKTDPNNKSWPTSLTNPTF
jgi:hypothetical protein